MFQVIYEDDSRTVLSGGDDTAYVQANRATVLGGQGNDWLAAVLRGLSEPLVTTLRGGAGHDTLHAALTTDLDSDDWSLTATLDGGAGNDEISIFAASDMGGSQSLTANGGAGADTITVESDYSSDDGYFHGVDVRVDGGSGADEINVSVFAAATGRTVIDGGSGNDTISADGLDNSVYGGDGHDQITVMASETGEWSNAANNYVEGGAGNDVVSMTVRGFGGTNTGYGGDGDDELKLEAFGGDSATNIAYGDAGDDTLTLNATASGIYWGDRANASNEAHGGDGHDTITASITLTTLEAEDRPLTPQSAINRLYGDAGDDVLTASITVDDPSELEFAYSELHGGAGDDRLEVSGGYGNILFGNQGDDTLIGGANDDRLIGGQGADYMRGNGGADVFEFWGARGLSAGERDRIADFTIGEDLIDVSRIDAKSWRAGNQSFEFDETGSGRSGTLWVEDNPDNWGSIVYANTGRAMLAINLLDGRGVDASDYSASDFIL